MNNTSTRVITAFLIASFVIGCGGNMSNNNEQFAEFEWFSYGGHDPVFEDSIDGHYINPIIAGFFPDPSIVRVDEDYYMVHSSFSYFPGVPIFHSRDLVNWTQIGNVLDRPSQLNTGSIRISRGIFAPAIRYHEGTFYMITTMVDGGGNFFVTAEDPRGPWSDPIWLPEVDGIDPSMFFDEDGTIYIMNNGPPESEPLYDGHRALWIRTYDPQTQTTGPATMIVDGGVDISTHPIWIEAPHIYKVDGRYILIAAEGGTGPNHSEVVFRADHPMGPYEAYDKNPILTQRHLDPDRENPIAFTGHADFVETPDGDWWAVFLGVRPYRGNHFNTGRETFLLPVHWTEDGWPVILTGDNTVPYHHPNPALEQDLPPEIPTTGNFTLLEEFDKDLGAHWIQIRTPHEIWHSIENGSLRLKTRPVSIGSLGQPSFMGRRQQHTNFEVSTKLRFTPKKTGDRAGLVAFQNDDYYLFVGIQRFESESDSLIVEAKSGQTDSSYGTILTSVPLIGVSGPIFLKIEGQGEKYHFSYSWDGNDWLSITSNVDGSILSTENAGGFTGTVIGMYTSREK